MNKTVLITGSSTGIGRATAEYFQFMGWNVAATMRSPEKEKELNELENVRCLRLDVQETGSIQSAFEETLKLFGGLDVIVNNAGYGGIGPFEAATPEQIQHQFATNVFGLMNVTRVVLPYFRTKKSGVIINVASAGGRMTWPLYSIYHGTKWAVEGYSESLQFELRPFGVRVKLIEPGVIRTDFFGRSQEFYEREGFTDFEEYVNRVMPNLQQAGAHAPGPEMVAEKIFKAANDKSWRLRYPVGRGAPYILLLRRLMPEQWFQFIVRKSVERRQDRLSKYKEG
jgi:NAD(P)-dependent dehydrogenase (short-subunit alcohol dehydrogenase family)